MDKRTTSPQYYDAGIDPGRHRDQSQQGGERKDHSDAAMRDFGGRESQDARRKWR